MTHLRTALLTALTIFLSLTASASAQEEILSFESRIVVQSNADLRVTEIIRVRGEGRQIKRGIFRDFPTTYQDRLGNNVKVGFTVLDVLRDGVREPHHTRPEGNFERLYIGSQDVLIGRGVHTYTIVYETDRQIGYFDDFDEIYWNVTGNDWSFPILKVKVTVSPPPGADILQSAAYTGRAGAQGAAFNKRATGDGTVVFETTRPLAVGEGITVAVGWPKGFVDQPSAADEAGHLFADNTEIFVGLAGLAVLLAYYLAVWLWIGRDPAKGTIIPLFKPPSGFSPALSRTLMNMGYDDKAFTAAVVNMAVKGAIIISEDDGVYTLSVRNKSVPSLTPGERAIFKAIFAVSQRVEMKERNHQVFLAAKFAFKDHLSGELAKAYYRKNSTFLMPGGLIGLAVVYLTAISRNANQDGITVLFAAVAFFFFMFYAGNTISRLIGNGARFSLRRLSGNLFGAGFVGYIAIVQGPTYLGLFGVPLTTTLIAVGVMMALFAHLLKAPTMKGRAIMDQLDGFKLFLSVAEKDRFDALHPPDVTPEVFEQYLPFALALDVEHQWSEKFDAHLSEIGSEAQGPDWYRSSHDDAYNGFWIADALSHGFSDALATASAAPGSETGSGGGGSSGGGGGGGGGGGW